MFFYNEDDYPELTFEEQIDISIAVINENNKNLKTKKLKDIFSIIKKKHFELKKEAANIVSNSGESSQVIFKNMKEKKAKKEKREKEKLKRINKRFYKE